MGVTSGLVKRCCREREREREESLGFNCILKKITRGEGGNVPFESSYNKPQSSHITELLHYVKDFIIKSLALYVHCVCYWGINKIE